MVGKNMSEIGKKYGKLIVIKKFERKEHQTIVYLCHCDCGNFKEVNINKLHTGHVKSCGFKCVYMLKDYPYFKESDFEYLRGKIQVLILEKDIQKRRSKSS